MRGSLRVVTHLRGEMAVFLVRALDYTDNSQGIGHGLEAPSQPLNELRTVDHAIYRVIAETPTAASISHCVSCRTLPTIHSSGWPSRQAWLCSETIRPDERH